jgi:hypothetical protein
MPSFVEIPLAVSDISEVKDFDSIRGHFYFQNGRQQNRQNFKVL